MSCRQRRWTSSGGLKALGFDPGAIDGIFGRRTIAAVKTFQKAYGLAVDGIVGPVTRAALAAADGKPAPARDVPPWYAEALRKAGLHEASNKRRPEALPQQRRRHARRSGQAAVVRRLRRDGDRADAARRAMVVNPYWARNWLRFGVAVKEPVLGAVCVFERGSGGHVGFVAGRDKTYLHVLGGNQSNRVSIAKLAKNRLLGMRMPATWSDVGQALAFNSLSPSLTTRTIETETAIAVDVCRA